MADKVVAHGQKFTGEYSLIRHNFFHKIWWINGFVGLTGFGILIVEYIDTGKLQQIKIFGV